MKLCGMGKAEVAMAIGHMCRLNRKFMPSGFFVTSPFECIAEVST